MIVLIVANNNNNNNNNSDNKNNNHYFTRHANGHPVNTHCSSEMNPESLIDLGCQLSLIVLETLIEGLLTSKEEPFCVSR